MNEGLTLVLTSGVLDSVDGSYLPAGFVSFLVTYRWVLFALLVLIPALPLPFMARDRDPSPKLTVMVSLCWAVVVFLAAFAVHRIPDEVFMNLLHAVNLVEWGRYSFHYDTNIDGTVAFLPCLFVGLFHAIGIKAPLAAILITAASSAATVFLLSYWASGRTNLAVGWLVGLTLAVNPSLLALSGSGWSAPFLALLAAAGIVLWDKGKRGATFALLATIAFVRWDSSFYTVVVGFLLVATVWFLEEGDWRKEARRYALTLLAPALFFTFWILYYGHPVPPSVEMKSGTGDVATLLNTGFDLSRDLSLELLPLVLCAILFAPALKLRAILPIVAWLIPSLIHTAGIAWGGGDYMWGHRYHVVLIVAVAAAGILGLEAWLARYRQRMAAPGPRRGAGKALSYGMFAIATLVLLAYSGQPKDIFKRVRDSGGDPKTLGFFNSTGIGGMRGSRITRHTSAGQFFTWLTEGKKDVKLATGEVASCYYAFSGRPIDIQGFANRDVSRAGRREETVAPWAKRLDPELWEREKPELVWLDAEGEFPSGLASRWVSKAFHDEINESAPSDRTKAFVRASRHSWWVEPYYEATYLDEHYELRVTEINDAIVLLWMVRDDMAAQYDRRLEEAGFQQILPTAHSQN